MFARWTELLELAERLKRDGHAADTSVLDPAALDAPVPVPLQAFGPDEAVVFRDADWACEIAPGFEVAGCTACDCAGTRSAGMNGRGMSSPASDRLRGT